MRNDRLQDLPAQPADGHRWHGPHPGVRTAERTDHTGCYSPGWAGIYVRGCLVTASASPGDGPLAGVVADWLDRDDVAENRAADEVRSRAVEVNALLAAAIAQAVTAHAGEGGTVERTAEDYKPHRIDIEAEWNEFITQQALVEPEDADRFLALLYGWRDECVTDARRALLAAHAEVGPVGTTVSEAEQSSEMDGIGMQLIRTERQRQIDVEGYTSEHDAEHGATTLVHAAGHYRSAGPDAWKQGPPRFWPWERSAWKPRDPISNLIRAGALYLAASDLGNPYGERNARDCAAVIDACHERITAPANPEVTDD